MNDQWTDRLSEYLDGELADAERVALEAHLASCAARSLLMPSNRGLKGSLSSCHMRRLTTGTP